MRDPKRDFLASLFDAAVAAADPLKALQGNLPDPPKGRTVVIGAGKGAAQLAQAFEQLWPAPFEGVVVTRYGYAAPCRTIRVLEAAHPVPDAAGLEAAQALKDAVRGLGPDDLVIALICGGGSSLLPDPPDGLTLDDLQKLNEALLASGAPISVMNDIRKCFSGINGGRLAELAAPAQVCSLIVSDVPGDAPGEVASGPTVPGRPAPADVRAMIRARGIVLPDRCLAYLENAPRTASGRAPQVLTKIIASAALSLKAAADTAQARGVKPWILSDAIEGEARDVAQVHSAIALHAAKSGTPFAAPFVMLSGGETTVTLRHKGRGGRNSEFQLSLAIAVDGQAGISALAADTDGIDGSEDNAGAFVDGNTASRMRDAGINPVAFLGQNDAYSAFEATDDLFVTGPTGTNVNDFRALLIGDLPKG
ncbi:glycerate kinase [Sulfitobacter mediterraneus]|uniref:glycerate kinase type-2 family protein n=1 Tax=Sulfitobacter mediterraneus TaxID=83219 RepID=UPI001932A445|nr:glycerate kinase [Sulfitobacter mediterraneus]MBM1634439.1 glycerate kinase [Sulfitobacter mediterraneus]MBM1642256.1 glycerate kinase [Sulfitobacter mediterraneus]MBM1646305.1 glycerate kinase [Sulfitobacter mediterraneus]MBM1650351.1 glycerate kinase [Sulfitobacter mediterraneus]MBM1654373.1 glycerate kinase [Sulfitobacter mediterraneus]